MFSTRCLVGIAAIVALASSAAAIPAFPGAEGAGAVATGGRNYTQIYHVTNLDNDGPGSFRDAISTGNRTVVFDVGGTINLIPSPDHWLRTGADNITIAGQTAPGEGIFLHGQGVKFTGDNVVLRNIHFRPAEDPSGRTKDAIWFRPTNGIADHCSAEWATDEGISTSDDGANVTVQYSIIAEGLNYDGHSYGSLIGVDVNNTVISYHHNLYAHNKSRNPRLGNETSSQNVTDFRNNVLYNWQGNCGYSGSGQEGDGQFVGNYYIAGNSTSAGDRGEAFSGGSTLTDIYQSGNKIDPNRNGVFDGTDTGWGMFTGTYTKQYTPFAVPSVYTQSADDALDTVLNYAGANWWNRDTVDQRIVNDVYNGTGSIINHVTDVEPNGMPYHAPVGRPSQWDSDNDGMPNLWELANGLNPSNGSDYWGDFDADGYRNIEEYLNDVGAFPAPKPIVWAGGTGRYELIDNWDIPFQPSRYDAVQINSGKASVGYMGQSAGTIYVGNSSGELAITAGSLGVTDGIYLGNASGSRGTLTCTGGTLLAGGQIVVASAAGSTGELTVTKDALVQVAGLNASSASGRVAKINLEVGASDGSMIHTSGSSALGGTVNVDWLDSTRPKEGDTFQIIDSSDPNATYTGSFDAMLCGDITMGIPSGLDPFGGQANGEDYELVFQGLTEGDANGDHTIDGGDLALMGGNWMVTSGRVWLDGDFNGDGAVDGGDLALMGGNWMWTLPTPPPGSAVPEPATIALLAMSSAALLRRGRGPRPGSAGARGLRKCCVK